MSNKTQLVATTAWAVAIAAALVAAPDAYSAGKKQTRAKQSAPYGSKLKPPPTRPTTATSSVSRRARKRTSPPSTAIAERRPQVRLRSRGPRDGQRRQRHPLRSQIDKILGSSSRSHC